MRQRIVYVDDNPADLELLRAAAAAAGWQVDIVGFETCGDAQAYLTRCAHDRVCPAVALIDLNIPGVTGWDLLAWIDDKPGMPTNKVVYTSSRRPSDLQLAQDLGASAFLLKPPDLDGHREVIARLRAIVEGQARHGAG